MMKKLLVFYSVVLLCACSAKILVPTQADADRGNQKITGGLTLADLNDGKMLYEQQCTVCHSAKKIRSLDEAGWKKIVPPMVQKANKRAGKEEIDAREQDLILKYVVTMSAK